MAANKPPATVVKNLADALRGLVGIFDEYVVSCKDSTGHELFVETGGVDFSLDDAREAIRDYTEMVNG